jgi:TRAP-type C4-dicarboxylate transport system substrate-binding protein
MKNIKSFVLVLVVILLGASLFISCAASPTTPSTTKPTTPPTAQPTTPPTSQPTTPPTAQPTTPPPSQPTTPAATGKEVEIKGQTIFPAEDLGYSVISAAILDSLNQKLKGRYHFTIFLPGMLVPPDEQFDATSKGSIQFSLTDFSFDSQFIPETIVAFALPGSWQTIDQDLKFFDKYGGLSFLQDSYAKTNIRLTYPLPEGRNSLMTKKQIATLSDFKGIKIWCTPPASFLVRDLGSEPTFLPIDELFTALQLGTVDGMTYSEPELKTLNFYQVVNYVIHPAIQEVLNVSWEFNLDTWKSFPPDVQNTIDSTIKELSPKTGAQYIAAANDGLTFFQSKGGHVVDLPPADAAKFNQMGRAIWDEVGKASPRTAQLVQMVRDFMKAENIQ